MVLKSQKTKIKAIALLSGGLDSRLAVKMMLDQGIDVLALNFTTCFCTCTAKSSCRSEANKAAEEFGIKLKTINQTEALLEAVRNPKHGFGRGLNPCIDCRIAMFNKAAEVMAEVKATFIITGEVLGERPMSQRLDAIETIERETGLKGKILRPLCAKLFEPTEVEKQGVVNREDLLSIEGRSRKPQIKLAHDIGLKDYPCPAGGCLLTDKTYAKRLESLLKLNSNPSKKALNMLRVGRHFVIDGNLVIIGRNESENARIEQLREEDDYLLECKDVEGPSTVIKGEHGSAELIKKAASLTARYSQGRDLAEVNVTCLNQKKAHEVMGYPKDGQEIAEQYKLLS